MVLLGGIRHSRKPMRRPHSPLWDGLKNGAHLYPANLLEIEKNVRFFLCRHKIIQQRRHHVVSTDKNKHFVYV